MLIIRNRPQLNQDGLQHLMEPYSSGQYFRMCFERIPIPLLSRYTYIERSDRLSICIRLTNYRPYLSAR